MGFSVLRLEAELVERRLTDAVAQVKEAIQAPP